MITVGLLINEETDYCMFDDGGPVERRCKTREKHSVDCGRFEEAARCTALSAAALVEPRHVDHLVQQPRGKNFSEGIPVLVDGAD